MSGERFEDLPSEEAQQLFSVIVGLMNMLMEDEAVANGNAPTMNRMEKRKIWKDAQIARNDLARQI